MEWNQLNSYCWNGNGSKWIVDGMELWEEKMGWMAQLSCLLHKNQRFLNTEWLVICFVPQLKPIPALSSLPLITFLFSLSFILFSLITFVQLLAFLHACGSERVKQGRRSEREMFVFSWMEFVRADGPAAYNPPNE